MARYRYGRRIRASYRAIVALDTFTRTDNASSLGSAETGQAWTASSGVFGVSNGQAYIPSSTGFVLATVPTGLSDLTVEASCTFKTGESMGVALRTLNASNRIFALIASNGVSINKAVAGANTTLGSWANTAVADQVYHLKVVAKGSALQLWVDGALRVSVTETDNQAETRVGIEAFKSAATPQTRWDNFRVTR